MPWKTSIYSGIMLLAIRWYLSEKTGKGAFCRAQTGADIYRYTEFTPKGIIAEPPKYIVEKEAHLCLRGTRYQIEIDVFVTIQSPYTNKGIRTDFLLRDDAPTAGLTATDLAIPEVKENEKVIIGTSHLYMQPEADTDAYCLLRKDAGIVEIQDAYGRRFILP